MEKLDIKVILVEDEQGVRESLHRILTNVFTNIQCFPNGLEAYDHFKKYSADIIITDINMPKMNGFELIEAAKKLHNDLYVIIITAFNDNENLATALELQVDKVLSKPISLDKLFDSIKKIKEMLTIKEELEYEKIKLIKFKDAIEKTDLVVTLDNEFNIRYLNSIAKEKLAIDRKTNFLDIFDKALIDQIKSQANKMESFHTIVNLPTRNLVLSLSSFASDFLIKNGEHHIHEISILFRDITETIKQKEEVINSLYTDKLTKLPNRLSLINKLESNNSENYTLAIVNIKSFSKINSFYGLHTGEKILLELSEQITCFLEEVPLETKLFKLEADNFCILFKTNSNMTVAQKKLIFDSIQELHNRIEDQDYLINGYNRINILVTLGISDQKVMNLLSEAILALDYAKTNNIKNVCFTDYQSDISKYENNLKMQTILKKAIISNKIVPFFQPIVNSDKSVAKYEALIRIVDGDTIYTPDKFLDVAKKGVLYSDLTKIMVRKIFELFHNNDYKVSINLSLLDITNQDTLDYIKFMFETFPSMKNRVIFELLESESFIDIDTTNQVCTYLQNLGSKIALDDFGSGYSNFSYLADLNIDILKIDASLTKKATTKNGRIILENIVNMAKQLDCKVIIEHVESKELFEHLKKLNIDMFQGYYFDKPKHWGLL